jgi:hypothetical protein
MTRTQALPYIAFYIDDALAERNHYAMGTPA